MDITVNSKQLKSVLETLLPIKQPVLITGRPGIGKSEIVESVSKSLGYKLVIKHPVVDDPTDYKGLGFVVNSKAEFLPFGDMLELIEADEPVICFLDDLGQASQTVQAAVMQLILARQVNGVKISDHVRFVAATNRREDKAAVSAMIQPLISRFSVFKLEVDVQSWVEWALTTTIPVPLIAACRYRPKWLTEWQPNKDIVNSPNPRNIAELGKVLAAGFPKDCEVAIYASRLGDAAAIELKAFMDVYMNLPNIDQIISDPDTAKVPSDPAGRFAMIQTLFHYADVNNFGRLYQYLVRFELEFQALFFKDVTNLKPNITATREFVSWATANQNVLL